MADAYRPTPLLCDPQYCPTMCIVLRSCYAMCGTDIAYGATRWTRGGVWTKTGSVQYLPTRALCDIRYCFIVAYDRTDIAYGGACDVRY
eukprot:623414-Rhodomonas_salina.3